tara:strand:+ start:396 stop:872 length:477 start_codon:yes stop_codon:yes gene_type:complete
MQKQETKEAQTLQLSGDKPNKEKKCSELVDKRYRERLEEFKKAQSFLNIDKETRDQVVDFLDVEFSEINNHDNFFEYANEAGLAFDYVEAGTFNDQRAGYYRWQLSYGGPSEELRLFDNGDLEYWYLDWFDGACVTVTDDVFIDLMNEFKDLSPRQDW